MTTPEHTLVGMMAAIALRIHSRLGWAAVVLAAVASNVPDLDGIPMLIDMRRFESGHRVWGHNFPVIVLSSALLAWTQFQYHWIERVSYRLSKYLPRESRAVISAPVRKTSFTALFLVGVVSQSLHLPCDMVVSGGHGLSDWLVFPFWPFVDSGFVFPLIEWGDAGPTIMLMLGAIGIAKMPERIRMIACTSLLVLCIYLAVRGFLRGTISF